MRATERRRKNKRPGRRSSHLGIWTLVAALLLLAAYAGLLELSRPHVEGDRLGFNQFVDLVELGRVHSARILDQDAVIVGRYIRRCPDDEVALPPAAPTDQTATGSEAAPAGECPTGEVGSYYSPYLKVQGAKDRLLDLLLQNRVPLTIDQQFSKSLIGPATFLIPSLLLVVVFVYLILSYRSGTGLFGIRSGARRIEKDETAVTFADVAGQEPAVAELRDIREFLADPERFAAIGARIPRGILLYGPPGCGKTLIARALAGETHAAFYSISGSDFVELYTGVGAARVRELFKEARANAPAIVFIDELDSIGRRRTGAVAGQGSSDEREQTLNQVLAEMDGFSPLDRIIVLAATNRADVLDGALLRPGRFDRAIGLERPSEAERLAILKVHGRGKRLEPGVDLKKLARAATGFSGADLANVMNEGALLAARAGKKAIGQADLDHALQRLLEAPERQRRLSMRDRLVAHRYGGASDRVTFGDVAGVDEAVEELKEVREYLAEPDRFARMGARVPRGILMEGPPGCGKTLLARALAGEANAAFLYVSASEFVEVFVGEGAARVRDLFAEAKSLAPAIVFIDEIDAIGARRATVSVGGQREVEQTLNQILTELDGFEARSGVIAVAATNRIDILDPALVRPGRFDRRVTINLPDRAGRRAILAIHAKGKPLGHDVDLGVLATLTQGFSGADLANVLNEAVLLAARRRLDQIPMSLMDEAIERAMLGVGTATARMNELERRMVAYHEAGHAIVRRTLGGTRMPYRISIIPRGSSLGAVWSVDSEETHLESRSSLLAHLAGLLGGRAAEELVFGEPSSGAADDLQKVGRVAREMVTVLGMGESLGPLSYVDPMLPDGRLYSEEAARLIDSEVRRVVDQAYGRAREILIAERAMLDGVAAALLERETLTREEFEEIAAGLGNGQPAAWKGRARA